MKKRGQVSLEYLAIFSFAMLLTLPLVSIYFIQQNNIQADITSAQVTKLSNEIVDAVEQVYYMGYPAQKTLRLNFPKGIENIVLTSNAITFVVDTGTVNFDVSKETSINISGSLTSYDGHHVLIIKNEGAYVSIEER